MYNSAVAGNCYDGGGFPIDVHFKVTYPEAGSTSNLNSTVGKQLIFNTNDMDHLGYLGTLNYFSCFYLNVWQGTANKSSVIRESYKRIRYKNNSIIKMDIVVDENQSVTNTLRVKHVDNIYNFSPNVVTTEPVEMITYYIYYNISTLDTGSTTIDKNKLLRVIDKDDINDLVIRFLVGGIYTIVCETMISHNTVSKKSSITINIENGITPDAHTQQHYIEWE